MTDSPTPAVTRIAITGELDRHAVEAIRLMVRRLARQHGFEVRESTERPDEATEP